WPPLELSCRPKAYSSGGATTWAWMSMIIALLQLLRSGRMNPPRRPLRNQPTSAMLRQHGYDLALHQHAARQIVEQRVAGGPIVLVWKHFQPLGVERLAIL